MKTKSKELEKSAINGLPKLKTYIPGFDSISNGGLPKGRTTLLSGTAGCGKTVIGCQFLAEGILQGKDNGVFITFEEPPKDIRDNMLGLGWDIAKWEKEGKWLFVDASSSYDEMIEAGDYDLGALMARIEFAINKVNAQRITVDSLGAIFSQLSQGNVVRKELFRITSALKNMNVTSLLTAERIEEYGNISRFGVEEFVTDNVIVLRNVLTSEKRRRTIEILKFRGTTHQKGEWPFTIVPGKGMYIIALSEMELKHKSSNVRISSGNKVLDQMTNGGYFRDSIILLSGATGTGKTLTATTFLAETCRRGEKALMFAFEESNSQLSRNAAGWGIDFENYEKEGLLKIICAYPEIMGLEDHLHNMKVNIEKFKPTRIAVDSLTALERVSTIKSYREFVIGLTSLIKEKQMAGLFTATTPTLMGGSSVTEEHISTITDSIILLRYVEMFGEMKRGITVLKMRGSLHDKNIREYSINSKGLQINKAFRNVSGILSGNIKHFTPQEADRLQDMFKEE